MEQKEFFVFISYSSSDNDWAIWLRNELEHYHLPASFNGRTDVRDNLRKVFRDRDELSAGPEWDAQVQKALEGTNNLIVICSPHSAKSDAVNKEIETFIALGKEDHIFPFIVEGDKPEDCFPKALKHSKLGGDIKKDGSPNIAFIKIVAGMLNVGFPELWNRYEIEKAEEERKIREERDKLLRAQSRFTSKTVLELSQLGDNHLARRLCLEIVPTIKHPDYPYTPEAESALRATMKDNVFTFGGHLKYNEIFTVQFSPDGKSVVSASKDNTVKIWDVNTGRCRLTITGKSDFHTSASYSPDGKYLALASRDNFIHIVDSVTGYEVKKLDGQSFIVESIVFSPNGRRLASVSRDDILHVWDFEKGKSIFTSNNAYGFFSPKYNSNRLNSNIFSPDGKYILIPTDDSFQIWDIDNKISQIINDFDGKIKTVSFSPNGCYFIVLSDNNTIYIWDYRLMKRIHAYKDNGRSIKSVLFAHNDSSLYICSESDFAKNFYRLDIKTGQKLEYGNLSFPAQSMCLSNDKIIVAGSVEETLFVKEFFLKKSYKLLSDCCAGINAMKYYDNGDKIIVCSADNSCILNSTSGECIRNIEGAGAFSVEIDSSETKAFLIKDKRLQIWDIQSGQCLRSFNGHDSILDAPIAMSKNGKRIVTDYGNRFFVWNVYSIKKIKCAKTLVCEYGGADCVCFSPDANMLAVAVCTNNYICIWDINKETIVQEMKGHTSHIISIAYSSDGKLIVTTSYDGSIRIWNTETGICKHIIDCSAKYAEFNHDNSKILSVTENVRVSIWDVETGMKIQDIDTPVDNAVFSPDGQSITITTDNTILIYPFIPYSKLIEQAYARYKDFLLTPEERKKYYLD
jgi:WD40 repeat protein